MMIGEILEGRYRVLSLLGEGAMGSVYLAEQMQLSRKEAIKVLHADIAKDATFVTRFRREARAINRLHHANIVSVYDFGQLPDGRLFLSMEYAEGRPLDRILTTDGALQPYRAIDIATQLALAADHAHSCGVLHRDLKPANVVVADRRGQDVAKVLDFGLAKFLTPEPGDPTALTSNQMILGTPFYMSPEQLQSGEVDPRSDIYAIGCVLYEMLVGEPPFSGNPAKVAHAHIALAPTPPSERRPDSGITKQLDQLVLTCLHKDPSQRFQSGTNLAGLLRVLSTSNTRTSRASRRTLDADTRSQLTVPDTFTSGVPTYADAVADTHAGASMVSAPTETHAEPRAPDSVAPFHDELALHESAIELAEALLDLGSGDHRLTLAVMNVRSLEEELTQADEERAHLAAREELLSQSLRERAGALRFAIGEIEFDRRRVDMSTRIDLEKDLEMLNRRLTAVHQEYQRKHDEVMEREIALAAGSARLEEDIGRAYRELSALVDALVPQYEAELSIAALVDRYRTIRELAPDDAAG